MTIKEQIDVILKTSNAELTAAQIAEIGEFSSRTIVSKYLRVLIAENKVCSEKRGRQVYYWSNNRVVLIDEEVDLWLAHEDELWWKIERNQMLKENTSENARGALQFAFTEMLNNAIDHSRSRSGYVKMVIENAKARFVVRDYGVGVFRKVQKSFDLEDEVMAIQQIMKGKVTTVATAHSGEGIFWVSKLAEKFRLTSYEYSLIVDNDLNDYSIEKLEVGEELAGTEVRFEMDARSSESLEDFFGKYLGDKEYAGLNFTVVQLGLYNDGSVWISRSQAKRVLVGLEKFERVVFDFNNIGMVGQAFCDEIFRVFAIRHPEIVLEPINMNDSVKMMVERAQNDPLGREEVS